MWEQELQLDEREHLLNELRESYRACRSFIPRRCPNGCSLFVVITEGGGQASAHACETVWRTVMAKFLFMIAVWWAASLGGTLWSLGGAAADAFKEWKTNRRLNQPRRVYVPA